MVITDYVHGAPITAVKAVNVGLCVITVRSLSFFFFPDDLLQVAGLVYFNMTDVGIVEGVKAIWKGVR